MDDNLEIGDTIQLHEAVRVALSRFAPHVKDVKEGVILQQGLSSYQHMAAVVQVGQDVVVKYGPYVSAAECETIHMVSKKTSVPVPEVYGVHKGDDGNTYIVMEYINGTCLYDIWDALKPSQKDRIANQMRCHFRELHGIQGSCIGTVGAGPCKDIYFDDTSERGPFASEELMNRAIVEAVRETADFAESFVTSTLPWLSINHAIVLCHGNLSTTHVIVDSEGESVVGIVGWQRSGFYPEYWDFVNALTLTMAQFRSDWVLYVEKFLKPYYDDYPLWCQLRMTSRWRKQIDIGR